MSSLTVVAGLLGEKNPESAACWLQEGKKTQQKPDRHKGALGKSGCYAGLVRPGQGGVAGAEAVPHMRVPDQARGLQRPQQHGCCSQLAWSGPWLFWVMLVGDIPTFPAFVSLPIKWGS